MRGSRLDNACSNVYLPVRVRLRRVPTPLHRHCLYSVITTPDIVVHGSSTMVDNRLGECVG
jgi:hypothetical protein